MTNFKEVTEEFHRQGGGERWVRNVDETCFISTQYRLTGFGYHEWETAIIFKHYVKGRPRTWKDSDCLIIGGDRRKELEDIPKEKLREWYQNNIEGNRNSMETILEAIKEVL